MCYENEVVEVLEKIEEVRKRITDKVIEFDNSKKSYSTHPNEENVLRKAHSDIFMVELGEVLSRIVKKYKRNKVFTVIK